MRHNHDLATSAEVDIGLLSRSVSTLLSHYPETMLQFTPAEIRGFVEAGRGIILPNPENPHELAAFAKLYQWPGVTAEGRILFELGSWLVHEKQRGKGYGEQVFIKTIQRGKEIDPNSQIIGVVEQGNKRSQELMLKLGGKIIRQSDWPSNFKVVLQDGTAAIVVIDITDIA